MILFAELEQIKKKRWKFVIDSKKKLMFNPSVEAVVKLMRSQQTELITGDIMAKLLTKLQNSDIFTNKEDIENQIADRHEAVNKFIATLKETVANYDQWIFKAWVPTKR